MLLMLNNIVIVDGSELVVLILWVLMHRYEDVRHRSHDDTVSLTTVVER